MFAARYTAIHLASILASQAALGANRVSDALERSCKMLNDDLLIANLRQNTVNSGCQMAAVFLRDQNVYVCTVGGLTVHAIKANRSGSATAIEQVAPVRRHPRANTGMLRAGQWFKTHRVDARMLLSPGGAPGQGRVLWRPSQRDGARGGENGAGRRGHRPRLRGPHHNSSS